MALSLPTRAARKAWKHHNAKLAKLCDRGRLAHMRGDFTTALTFYAKALQLDASCAFAYHYGSLACRHLLRAARSLGRVTPDQVQAVQQIAYEFMAHAVAWTAHPRTKEEAAASGAVLHNMADMRVEDGAYDEAVAYLRLALQRAPEQVDSWWLLGNALQELGQAADGRAAHDQCLTLTPTAPGSRYNQSFLRLRRGDYAEGWRLYESRFDAPDFRGSFVNEEVMRRIPLWRGESLAGKRLYVYGEQGNGDHIQFARFVPYLQQAGVDVVMAGEPTVALETLPSLARLFRCALPTIPVVAQGEVSPRGDYAISLMSLPHRLGITLDTVPPPLAIPALEVATSDPTAPYLAQMAAAPGKVVGIAWSGSVLNALNARRSIPDAALAVLKDTAGVTFVNLQLDGAAAFAEHLGGIDPTPALVDFAATAAVIQRCDLVIGIDSAVSHLAGSCDVPLWVALSYFPDWRWMDDREDSPWYPQARLWRQTAPNDWTGVLTRIRAALTEA